MDKEKFKIGDRIALNDYGMKLPYVMSRLFYTNMYEGKKGTVIGYSGTGKVAVEFDDIVFTQSEKRISSHNNGCHGKGKLNYCWYLPEIALEFESKQKLLLLLL